MRFWSKPLITSGVGCCCPVEGLLTILIVATYVLSLLSNWKSTLLETRKSMNLFFSSAGS